MSTLGRALPGHNDATSSWNYLSSKHVTVQVKNVHFFLLLFCWGTDGGGLHVKRDHILTVLPRTMFKTFFALKKSLQCAGCKDVFINWMFSTAMCFEEFSVAFNSDSAAFPSAEFFGLKRYLTCVCKYFACSYIFVITHVSQKHLTGINFRR